MHDAIRMQNKIPAAARVYARASRVCCAGAAEYLRLYIHTSRLRIYGVDDVSKTLIKGRTNFTNRVHDFEWSYIYTTSALRPSV